MKEHFFRFFFKIIYFFKTKEPIFKLFLIDRLRSKYFIDENIKKKEKIKNIN
jgi:hypothetical protein